MKKIYLICLMATVFSGCQSFGRLDEEVQVIHQTFEQATVGVSENDFHNMLRLGPSFPPPGANPLAKRDTALRKVRHLYEATDSLFNPAHFKSMPNKFDHALANRLAQTSLRSEFAELAINETDYQLVKANHQSTLFLDKNFNGKLSFSRVVFNENRTEACYYFEQSRKISHGGWGMGTLVFATKKDGRWIFKRAKEIWIT